MKKALFSTVILLGIVGGLFAAVAAASPGTVQTLNHGANYDVVLPK